MRMEILGIEISGNLNSEEDLDINKMTVKQLKDLVTQRGISFEQSTIVLSKPNLHSSLELDGTIMSALSR